MSTMVRLPNGQRVLTRSKFRYVVIDLIWSGDRFGVVYRTNDLNRAKADARKRMHGYIYDQREQKFA